MNGQKIQENQSAAVGPPPADKVSKDEAPAELLTFESLQALRHEPAATRTAIRIANHLSCDEIAGSPIAHNTLILLRDCSARRGSPYRLRATNSCIGCIRRLLESNFDDRAGRRCWQTRVITDAYSQFHGLA